MIRKIQYWWDNYGFEILLVSCVVFILFFALCRIGKKGTWSTSYTYDFSKPKKKKKKRVVKESSGEKECRKVLQYLFKKPFKNTRPDFLRNPVTGGNYNLELDCFEPSLRLAVEYNGAQHYKYIPYFHKNKEAFLNQKYRDDMKRRMCKQEGICLIEVPNTVKKEEIYNYLVKQLRKNGYKI